MLSVFYELYFRVKTYFNTVFNINNNTFDFTKINEINQSKILKLNSEIKELYSNINVKQMFKLLKSINNTFDESTLTIKIIEYLEDESKFILKNKDNLEVSINEIKQNTLVLDLIHQFKILKDIRSKETEIKSYINKIDLKCY